MVVFYLAPKALLGMKYESFVSIFINSLQSGDWKEVGKWMIKDSKRKEIKDLKNRIIGTRFVFIHYKIFSC